MTIQETLHNDILFLNITGRVDTPASAEVQKAILLAFQKCKHVILDFTGVEFITSAGLRALLIGQKTAASKGGSFLVRGVNQTVYDVLHITGFERIIPIERI